MLIIPAIDILDGAVVRLTRGDFALKKVYSSDPVAVAKELEKRGARMLHVVDLNGAKTGVPRNQEIIAAIAKAVRIPLEIGGGIRDARTARTYLGIGSRIILGTKALEEPELIKSLIKEFGSDRIIVALEIKDGKIVTEGWQTTLERDYRSVAGRMKEIGVRNVLFTDVDRDGTLTEPNIRPVRELAAEFGFRVIASGGVSDVTAIRLLRGVGAHAAVMGTALYENRISLKDALEAAVPISTLAKRIVPCLDVKDGKVVKGISFQNLKDVGDPVTLGKKYSDEGADELVFLDISASREGRETMFGVAENVAKEVFIPFTVGGGISTVEQMRRLLLLGAEKVSINTAAVKNPELITEAARAFGEQCIVVAIDAKRAGNGWRVFLKGGSEETKLDAIEWAREASERGAGEILLTSMDKDGTQAGYDVELLKRVSDAVRVPVIASGGAGSLEDLKAAISEGKADAVLVASLFHYGEYSIRDAKEYLAKEGIRMRL